MLRSSCRGEKAFNPTGTRWLCLSFIFALTHSLSLAVVVSVPARPSPELIERAGHAILGRSASQVREFGRHSSCLPHRILWLNRPLDDLASHSQTEEQGKDNKQDHTHGTHGTQTAQTAITADTVWEDSPVRRALQATILFILDDTSCISLEFFGDRGLMTHWRDSVTNYF